MFKKGGGWGGPQAQGREVMRYHIQGKSWEEQKRGGKTYDEKIKRVKGFLVASDSPGVRTKKAEGNVVILLREKKWGDRVPREEG